MPLKSNAVVRVWPHYKVVGLFLRCAGSTLTSTSPSLLLRVRNDIKLAMKAKDSARLDVLRGVIAEVTNSAKSSKPVTTDSQMVNIIRKRLKSSETAAEEFRNANREDLESQEVAQIAVLEEYMPRKTPSQEALVDIIQDVIGKMRTEGSQNVNSGSVIKTLVGEGGALDGQLVNMKEVADLVRRML